MFYRFHGLRKRVTHIDSLLNIDVKDLVRDGFALAGSIQLESRQWVTGTSSVLRFLESCSE